MASGYEVSGTDLDSIFAPYHSGWPKAAATGYEVGGADLNTRYAPLSTGTAAAVTHYEKGGADLNTIFAALGSTNVEVATQPSAVSGSAAAGNPSGTVTSNTTTVAGEKGGGTYTYTVHIASGSATPTAPSSATSGVTNTAVPAGTELTGTMYWTISDGVSSINTNTVGWSLTNTTPATITVDATLVAGFYQQGTSPNILQYIGFSSPKGTGSFTITSGSIPGSGVVWYLWTEYIESAGSYSTVFMIEGASPAIGQNGLISVTINGNTLSSSSASSYTDNSGQEEWSWVGTNLDLTDGDSYPVVMIFAG